MFFLLVMHTVQYYRQTYLICSVRPLRSSIRVFQSKVLLLQSTIDISSLEENTNIQFEFKKNKIKAGTNKKNCTIFRKISRNMGCWGELTWLIHTHTCIYPDLDIILVLKLSSKLTHSIDGL